MRSAPGSSAFTTTTATHEGVRANSLGEGNSALRRADLAGLRRGRLLPSGDADQFAATATGMSVQVVVERFEPGADHPKTGHLSIVIPRLSSHDWPSLDWPVDHRESAAPRRRFPHRTGGARRNTLQGTDVTRPAGRPRRRRSRSRSSRRGGRRRRRGRPPGSRAGPAGGRRPPASTAVRRTASAASPAS